MQIAKCWLILEKNGSNVPLKNVTPAELVLLVRDRMAFVGRFPIHNLEVMGKSKRTHELERNRLRNKYGKGLHNEQGKVRDRDNFKIDALYPGEGTALPITFTETRLFEQASENSMPSVIAPDVADWEESELAKLDAEDLEPVEAVDPMDEIKA